ncbi:MAG: 1,4-alpha-glucan branching protein GlgB, partial [Acidimicrobiia bacterium]
MTEGQLQQRPWQVLGAHHRTVDGTDGVAFSVWAPNARRVSVTGAFCNWHDDAVPLTLNASTGVWEGFVAGVRPGDRYRYVVRGADGRTRHKTDPYAQSMDAPPGSASHVAIPSAHAWADDAWLAERPLGDLQHAPMRIYEAHLGSWRRGPRGRFLTYEELGPLLAEHCLRHGFTHLELLPLAEHPVYASWGYQVTAFHAPTARYGTPDQLRGMVDLLHRSGIGVILDWVPAHFASDSYGLARFDGTHLYEDPDPQRREHPEWGSLVFNFGRAEIRDFLIGNARYWLEEFHVDGLRVDAVASMLYLDYSRKEGEWVPNAFGGREDLEAVAFLKELNELLHAREPGVISAAEESTAWPGVSRPTYVGGLGFGFKWNMGWMHDTLGYFQHDPIHRRFHHHELTFSLVYAWNENFILPLSHDEVVHGKGSLLQKLPGDRWQQLANLRALLAYMWAHPGKKLLFMGGELATPWEWTEADELPWWLLEHVEHSGMRDLVRDLNAVYAAEPALWEVDFSPEGFRWLEPNDSLANVVAFMRL